MDETTNISVKNLVCSSIHSYWDTARKASTTILLDPKEIADGRSPIYGAVEVTFNEYSVNSRDRIGRIPQGTGGVQPKQFTMEKDG